MSKTIIEKIISRASGKDAKVGERVWVKLDLVAMRDFGGPNVVLDFRKHFPQRHVYDSKKVAITFDLHIPPRNEKVAKNQQILRGFAAEEGVHLFDINTGIGQHILLEHGLIKPGSVVVGTDSHMNLLGAVGSFATGVGTTDIVSGLALGKLWFRVPPTIKIILEGRPQNGVLPKDVILYLLKFFKTDGLNYLAVEFFGDYVESLPLSGRITLASMITEMSGKIGFIATDMRIKKELSFTEDISPDPDATYMKEYRFDISKIEPLIALPHSPDNVVAVSEVEGTQIDEVFMGSCTNGREDDFRMARNIIKDREVKVRTIAVPATHSVMINLLKEGIITDFAYAGIVIPNPSCALCTTGHPGILAPGEKLLSTSNRNYVGKIGKGGLIHLVSPLTAAASAVEGKITDPRRFL